MTYNGIMVRLTGSDLMNPGSVTLTALAGISLQGDASYNLERVK